MGKPNGIMVCVTTQRTCDALIARGIERGGEGKFRGADMHIVHFVEKGRNFMNSAFEADAIEYLFTAAQLAGADMNLLRAESVDDALVDFAKTHGIALIILGSGRDPSRESVAIRLQRRLSDVEFDVVNAD